MFDISSQTSQFLNVVFTCFLYSGGMPVLNIICFFFCLFLYWSEKFLILRHYRRPPKFTADINYRVVNLLPYAIILHCGFSLYAYGTEDIFPTDFKKEDGYVIGETEYLNDRMARLSGILNMLLILATIAVIIFNYTLIKLVKTYVMKKYSANLNPNIKK